jgi:hypothetical protein
MDLDHIRHPQSLDAVNTKIYNRPNVTSVKFATNASLNVIETVSNGATFACC